MRRRLISMIAVALTGLLVVAAPGTATAQAIERLSAEFQFTPYPPGAPPNIPEFSTAVPAAAGGAGGKVTYSKTVFVKNDGVLFVTFYGTANEETSSSSFNILMMTCVLDGVICQPGGGFTGLTGPDGWVPLQNINPNLSDNNISYSWCVPVQKGARTIDLKLGVAGDAGGRVYYERSHVYIDSVKAGTCNQAALVPGAIGGN